ncbi:hypothetical protein B0H17DRAFT_1105000 [Mycena rosella]|uniref:Ubiquitin-like domain-containing protein n=1 Tax=Mycena rosella TaxID=1033263 RepID=A0AAD7FTS0_MYCRO|nr:hypothetical protein B0H17DRAFT_1105000 [Mycena rosella]
MASLAFAYGSFGDILATVQLAIKIAIVLHRSGAPSKECTETEKELKLLGNDLHLALLCLQQTSASPLAPFVAKRIDEEVVQCHKLLARFFGKISAPQASSLWKKIYWAACEGKELAAFRMKLLERRTALTLVVELINSGALRAIQDRIDKVRVGVSGIAHQMLVQHEQLVAVIDHVPHGVAEAMFTVISPTGIAIPISVTYCGSYQVLDGLLKMYMRNRKEAGGDYVERGDYNVVSQGVVIRPPQFTGTLKAGMRLEMSILQRGHQVPAKNCPQCGSPSTPLPDIGWFTCQNSDCESRYQVLESKTSAGLHAHGSGSSRYVSFR